MRKRIKTIKTERVPKYKGEEVIVKFRKDSFNLPSVLPDVIKEGLIFDI